MKLEVKNLSVALENQPILRAVSLDVADGEFVSLLGPSGCGKSTMLKTIAGLLPAAAGEIILGGRDVTGMPAHKRGTVVVFQDLRMFPHMTAVENVAFPLKMRGVPKGERLARAAEYLKKVQLEGREHQSVTKMSGGQQQRVALARALAAEPKLLLLDEPFSALDENLREDMRSLVRQLHREFGMTTVLVTHDRAEALSMSDRIALMFDGQIVQCDRPRAVYDQPATRQAADYFGDCVYLPGTVSEGVFRSDLVRLPADRPDGTWEMMLRPADVMMETGEIPAVVAGIHYYGAQTAVELELPGGIRIRKTDAATGLQIGQSVMCAIRPQRIVLFPKR